MLKSTSGPTGLGSHGGRFIYFEAVIKSHSQAKRQPLKVFDGETKLKFARRHVNLLVAGAI
jgi:hypothetical protein